MRVWREVRNFAWHWWFSLQRCCKTFCFYSPALCREYVCLYTMDFVSAVRAKMHYYYYMWPFAKNLYHGWISTTTSSNEISWKLPPPKWRAGCAPAPDPWPPLLNEGHRDRSHFLRLRLHSFSKIFESGSSNFSNLRIRLLFSLLLPTSIQPKFTHIFTLEMTTQTPATAEIEKWLRIRVRFFTNFWLRIRTRKKNAESCRSRFRHSGSMSTFGKGLGKCFPTKIQIKLPSRDERGRDDHGPEWTPDWIWILGWSRSRSLIQYFRLEPEQESTLRSVQEPIKIFNKGPKISVMMLVVVKLNKIN